MNFFNKDNLPPTANDAPDDPFGLFSAWFSEAETVEAPYPNAMSLATVDADGKPSVRTVLLKGFDNEGFVFYTNMTSRKGKALAANPFASLNFYWKKLERQVRIEGAVTVVSDEEADEYFASRPRDSRIGAWASHQSQPLESRDTLKARIAELEKQYEGQEDIPRPPHWSGYRLTPDYFEFWHEGLFRLHTRVTYSRQNGVWVKQMLNP